MDKTFSFQDKNSPEKLIAGLNIIGLHYVIGEGIESFSEKDSIGPPEDLIAGLVRQTDARLRSALIALFLYKPGYSKELPVSCKNHIPTDLLKSRGSKSVSDTC